MTQSALPAPATAPRDEKKKGLSKLWPFGKGKNDQQDSRLTAVPVNPAVHSQDYAPGVGDSARQGFVDDQQYGEDIVDWLDVIGTPHN